MKTKMEKSESIKSLAGALAVFQSQVGNVAKDGTNPFFKSKYATLENVISTVKPLLEANGLAYAQLPDGDGLYTIITHSPSGEWIGAHAALELKGHTPQDQGSAITYMRRYALSAALGLATEDDDDGNAASKSSLQRKVENIVREVDTPARTEAPKATPARPKSVADKIQVQKARIKELCDEMAIAPLLSGDEYKSYVFENTLMPLEEENYSAIIDALESIRFINTIK